MLKTTVFPSTKRVILEAPEPRSEMTSGGIVLPESAGNVDDVVVLNVVHDGLLYVPDTVALSYKAAIKSGSGIEVSFEGKKYLSVPEEEVLAFWSQEESSHRKENHFGDEDQN